MKIVLDTSIIYKDFSLSNSTFRTFFDGLKRTGYSLHMPQIVYEEALNKYLEKLNDSKRDIENTINRLERFVNQEFNQPVTDVEIQKLTEKYQSLIDMKLAEVQTHFLNYPKISHQEVVKRALKRRKPFNEKGAGYRDTLIWHSILELAITEPIQPIAFVSANVKDFADEAGTLHAELLSDVHSLGGEYCEVTFFSDLESFVNEYIKPTMEILEDIQTQLALQKYPDLNLENFIVEDLISFVGRVEFESRDIDFPNEFENPSLSQIEDVYAIDGIEVRQLSTGELLISLSAGVWAEFDFFVYKSDYYGLSEENQRLIWDHDWNEHYRAGSMSKEIYLELNLTFDTVSKQVTSAEIADISPVRKVDFTKLGKIFEEYSRRQSEQMARILDSSQFASNALQPLYEQSGQITKMFEKYSRQQSEQLQKIISSAEFSSKALEPLFRKNDEIKKMLEKFTRLQSERIAKLIESFQVSDETLKGISGVLALQIPSRQSRESEEKEDSALNSDTEEDSPDENCAQDEENE